MNISDKAAELIYKINTSKLEEYLTLNEWILEDELNNVANIWHRKDPNESEYELIVPKNNDLKDYKKRILEVFSTLSVCHNVEIDQIIKNIQQLNTDKIKIRVKYDDVKDGTIPMLDGLRLFSNAKDLLVSASLASISKNRYFSNYRPEETIEFINSVRLGQTEIGSYVVNIFAPIYATPDKLDNMEEPFTRKVSRTLVDSLSSLKDATNLYQQNSEIEDFLPTVDSGVSANLCDALIELSGERRNRNINIYVQLSEDQESREEITFESSEMEILQRASYYLKEDVLLRNNTIEGYVVKLNRDESHDEGFIVLKTTINKKKKNIKMQLNKEQYEVAVHAHESQAELRCTGDLHLQNRNNSLIDVTAVEIVVDQDDINDESLELFDEEE